jgi:hypothetical protein
LSIDHPFSFLELFTLLISNEKRHTQTNKKTHTNFEQGASLFPGKIIGMHREVQSLASGSIFLIRLLDCNNIRRLNMYNNTLKHSGDGGEERQGGLCVLMYNNDR